MNTPSLTLTKTLLGLVAVATFSPALHAQDSIEIDEARKAARKLSEAGARISDAPFAVDVDLDKPQGIKASGVGLIVLPDRKCSSELLAAANSAITPLGQLWTLKLAVATDGKATAAEKLHSRRWREGARSKSVLSRRDKVGRGRTGIGGLWKGRAAADSRADQQTRRGKAGVSDRGFRSKKR
jgi:hypothetical protein